MGRLRNALRQDHPRIRGEHLGAGWSAPAGRGSSPHTRGAPLGHAHRDIPGVDHPRIRGEHARERRNLRGLQGSSPHTRGARTLRATHRRRARIIPAYAGSTLAGMAGSWPVRDHPRIRGEHYRPGRYFFGVGGSSPHTRGARRIVGVIVDGLGIIPAYAGSTFPGASSGRAHTDHPRIRGEHTPFCDARNM